MNIYLINEDGDSSCIKANTMYEAVTVCRCQPEGADRVFIGPPFNN